jgi:ATP-binding cassette subfamily F protein 3
VFLGGFGFSGDRVLEAVKNFSGGEKSRLALALIVYQQPNLLLLDEPTNHLDMDMRHALSMALQEYQGAMIIVSHDRFLIKTTVDQLMLVADGELKYFDGDLNDYQKWLIDFRKPELSDNEKPDSRKSQRQLDAKQRELRRPFLQNIKNIEEAIAKLQKQLTAIEGDLTNTDLYQDNQKNKLQKLLLEQAKLNKQIKEQEEKWLTACEELELYDKEK